MGGIRPPGWRTGPCRRTASCLSREGSAQPVTAASTPRSTGGTGRNHPLDRAPPWANYLMRYPVPSLLSRSRCIPLRFVVVLLAGLLAAGVLSPSARAETAGSAGRIGGLVLDRSNQRTAGATVTVTGPDEAVAGSTHTDDRGRWSLSIPQGDYDLAVTAQQDDHTLSAKIGRYSVGADTTLNVILAGDPDEAGTYEAAATVGNRTAEATATFTRAAAAMTGSPSQMVTFSGQVLDADGNPVERGVSISLARENPYAGGDVMVEDGTFSLDVPAGTYTLRVATDVPEECGGCPEYRTDLQAHNYFVNNFGLDGDRAETIRLPRPAVMTVTVVDPSNRPVAGAWVDQLDQRLEPGARHRCRAVPRRCPQRLQLRRHAHRARRHRRHRVLPRGAADHHLGRTAGRDLPPDGGGGPPQRHQPEDPAAGRTHPPRSDAPGGRRPVGFLRRLPRRRVRVIPVGVHG